jgi:hypothetical protein
MMGNAPKDLTEYRLFASGWHSGRFSLLLVFIAVAVQSAVAGSSRAGTEQNTDIVIVGAGTSGVSAAIQAARLGAQVALLEETDWVGGQMTASADVTMDEGGSSIVLNSGLYAEFVQRMYAHYLARGKSVGTCYWNDTHHCYEPSVIQKILLEMINDTNDQGKGHISLHLREKVIKVLGTDQVVTGVVTQKGQIFSSKVVIDATEFGDILPLAHAAYRIGHFTSAQPGKSCIQDIAYMAVLKKYPNGVPPQLLMQHPPPGYDSAFVASMRRFLRADGNPTGNTVPVNFEVHNRLRALPDSSNSENYTASAPVNVTKTALNFFNDFPANTDLFDRSTRQDIVCAAKLKSLNVIFYIQHELKESSWSVANDEGYDTPQNREDNSCPNIPQEFKALEVNFPPLPYVRESRRLIGLYTLTGGDVRRELPWAHAVKIGVDPPSVFSNAIAVGDYPAYLHDCNTEADYEHDLEHATDLPSELRPGTFQVPIEVLIPEKVDGLLAAEKNISESRIANSVTRMQPITMLIGQAAGALAAIAVAQQVQPRRVNPVVVQRTLLASNSALAKEDLSDLPRNVDEWRAAEYALVHGWLRTVPEGFGPQQTLTRGTVAEALVAAFQVLPPPNELERRWGYQASSTASFKDVPLYSKYSPAVEALVALHASRSCLKSTDLFCPEDVETVGDFISSLNTLRHQSIARRTAQSGITAFSGSDSRNAAVGEGDDPEAPLTRIQAAELLYRYLDPAHQGP